LKICYVKKNQIYIQRKYKSVFIKEKFRSTSNEDVDQFSIEEKFIFTSNEDVDHFFD